MVGKDTDSDLKRGHDVERDSMRVIVADEILSRAG